METDADKFFENIFKKLELRNTEQINIQNDNVSLRGKCTSLAIKLQELTDPLIAITLVNLSKEVENVVSLFQGCTFDINHYDSDSDDKVPDMAYKKEINEIILQISSCLENNVP